MCKCLLDEEIIMCEDYIMNKKLLKNKNFMLVVTGNFVSLIGSNIMQFVLSLYVLALTGSATIFATMLAISILPRIFLSPIAGVFGDWFDKKKSIIFLDILNAVIIGVFSVYVFYNGGLSMILIYVLVILLEITEIFFHSSMSALLPSVVKKEDFLEANALRTMLISFGQLLAPVFGAIIFGSFGLLIALIINAASFLLSAVSEMFIKTPKHVKHKDGHNLSSFKTDFKAGIQLVKDSKPIRTIMFMAVIVNFSMAPFFSVGLTFLIKEVFQQSDIRLGLLQTVLSAAMIIAPILLTKKLKTMRLGDVLMKSFFMMSILVIMVSFSLLEFFLNLSAGFVSYIYVLVICFFIGIIVTGVNIAIGTLVQNIVPIEFMGRTSTVLGLFSTIAIPLGQMLFGYLYDMINPGIVFIFNGLIILLTVFIFHKRMHLIDDNNPQTIKNTLKESSVLEYEV